MEDGTGVHARPRVKYATHAHRKCTCLTVTRAPAAVGVLRDGFRVIAPRDGLPAERHSVNKSRPQHTLVRTHCVHVVLMHTLLFGLSESGAGAHPRAPTWLGEWTFGETPSLVGGKVISRR